MAMGKVLAWLIGISLFCGVMIGWVGPIVFAPIAQVAQPIVCPGGDLAQQTIRGASQGEVTYNTTFQCYRGTGENGTGEDVTASAIFAAIGIYSAIAFVLLCGFGLRALRSQTARMREALRAIDAPGVEMRGKTIDMRGADLATKLDVLATLRTQGLIDETRYEAMVTEARAKG